MIEVVTQSVIPLILFLVLQIPVFFVGALLLSEQEKNEWSSGIAVKTHVSGQLLLWAILQVMAVAMIQAKLSFNVLYYCFLSVSTLCAVLGCLHFFKNRKTKKVLLRKVFIEMPAIGKILLIAVIVLIAFQVLTYYFGQHIDQDDARWLAEANDALVYGDMLRRNVSTGEYLGYFNYDVIKDLASPWAMFFAVIAKLLSTQVATSAHSLYAPIALLMSYEIYWLIGSELFEKAEARWAFLFFVSVFNLFYARTTHTQSVFTLVRIWQGKATVAGIIIPFLVYIFIVINKRNETIDWLRLGITGCAACLLSGMGISISGIIIGVLGVYSIVAYQRFRRIPLWIISEMPTVVFGLLYFYYKG